MPLSKDRPSYLVWIQEKKRFGPKANAEKELSLRKRPLAGALAAMWQHKLLALIFRLPCRRRAAPVVDPLEAFGRHREPIIFSRENRPPGK